MKKLVLFVAFLLSACSTTPKPEVIDVGDYKAEEIPRFEAHLQTRLGMVRAINSLGYEEQAFNPCQYGLKSDAKCTKQYLTVLHFQLLCRDTEGTVTSAPLTLTPITTDNINWKLVGKSGGTRTDAKGYGQLTFISPKSSKGQRLILRIGKQFLGFTASDMSKIVLPKNFCS